ncbi:MAG: dephospho-CoA kinase [Bacteroidales bacterium]|jgi:dephospho-CoA kinase|nr:dephospho-CoA kinase [Bacteroidales bacterium]
MLKVGVTGTIGSGKTTVCHIFERLHIPVYYSDREAKKQYEYQDVKAKLSVVFGDRIFTENNAVDTKKLAQLVFNDVALLRQLNAIVHPLVEDDFEQWSKSYRNYSYVLFESAVLYSCRLTHLFDKIIVVDAPFELIIRRVMQRDAISAEAVCRRIKMQLPENQENTHPDYIITNDGEHLLIPQIIDIHKDLDREK